MRKATREKQQYQASSKRGLEYDEPKPPKIEHTAIRLQSSIQKVRPPVNRTDRFGRTICWQKSLILEMEQSRNVSIETKSCRSKRLPLND